MSAPNLWLTYVEVNIKILVGVSIDDGVDELVSVWTDRSDTDDRGVELDILLDRRRVELLLKPWVGVADHRDGYVYIYSPRRCTWSYNYKHTHQNSL